MTSGLQNRCQTFAVQRTTCVTYTKYPSRGMTELDPRVPCLMDQRLALWIRCASSTTARTCVLTSCLETKD